MQKKPSYIVIFCLILSLFSCKNAQKDEIYTFELLDAEKTGINFSNDIAATNDLSIFNYMYFYNGGGVGAGDLNNDGLIDLVFTANIKENKIYLNRGKMHFEDVTAKAFRNPSIGGEEAKGWSNGVSIVDINQDGKLDIYISQVSGFEGMKGHNLLYICQEITKDGVPIYAEKSTEYGLDLVGFGTQAAFFDYDLDGDLDMFMLNHSVHQNGTFGARDHFKDAYNERAGDRLFKNNSMNKNGTYLPHYEEVTKKTGINANVLGYGLGVAIGDVNNDGYPDIYVGNDFHENDYLYINQKNGTFKDDSENQIMHTSKFSMGVDIGDLNNDIYPEIISLDMLPYDRDILKRSEGEDSYNLAKFKVEQGYSHQYSRNNLQLNNGNNTFSEIALYSGIYATDWSWASLFLDFDNDGRKDLFISNGIPKRMNDSDYIDFISNEEMQRKIEEKRFDELEKTLIDKIPEIKIPNKFFVNSPTLQFRDAEKNILNNQNSYSNGAIYADLDNDGDLDIVTNNINQKAFVYENKANNYAPQNAYLKLSLKGSPMNLNAIGARVLVFKKNETISYEKFPVKGFQSSMEIPMNIGLGNKADADSIYLIWTDKRYQKIPISSSLSISYDSKLPIFDFAKIQQKPQKNAYKDIAFDLKLDAKHDENNFVEFDREALIPQMMSAEGPALAVADINHDGLEDVFMGSSKTSKAHLYLQMPNGLFKENVQMALEKDSIYEEIDAVFTDVNNDSYPDLLVAEGGNEFFGKSEYLNQRLYLNDGKGNFSTKTDAFPNIHMTASCIKPMDFDKDGKMDVFIGGRSVPLAYGETPKSYLLKNDGTGKFTDVTQQFAQDLASIGFVKNATWQDLDKDGDQDLLLALEWDGVVEMENQQGKFVKKMLTQEKGWWNFTMPFDFDNDGDVDILVGNLGLNSRLKASKVEPVRMYVGDFDKNDRTDQIISYYLGGQEVLFANKMETQKQFPFTKKKYLLAKDFAKASIKDLLGESNLASSKIFEANYFENAILVNDGKGNFTLKALPFKAQFAPYYTSEIIDINGDKLPDVLILGNFYDCNIQMGRYDADYGTVLINKGNCRFEVTQLNGLSIKGQVKHSQKIRLKSGEGIIIARNNDKLMVLSKKK